MLLRSRYAVAEVGWFPQNNLWLLLTDAINTWTILIKI
jgi:hypothetical protein